MANKAIIRRIEAADIDYILDNLWENSQQEAVIFGVPEIEDLRQYLYSKLDQRMAYTITDNQPIAVFGATDQGDRVFTTWFVATPQFIDYYASITRALKKIIQDQIVIEQALQVVTYSACLNEKVERWFSLLGLYPDPANAPDIPIKRFVYGEKS